MFEIIGIIVFVLIVAILVEYEQGTISTLLIISGSIALYYLPITNSFTLKVLNFVATNPGLIVGTTVTYIALGVVYAFVKWYYLIKDYQKENPNRTLKEYPKARYEKAAIIRWISYWIFNFWITLIHRPLIALVESLEYAFDSLTKKIVEK